MSTRLAESTSTRSAARVALVGLDRPPVDEHQERGAGRAETVPAVPGVPVRAVTSGKVPASRGHYLGTGVPGVPTLSNSVSLCPVAECGRNTWGRAASPLVLQPHFVSADVPLACH